MSEIAIRVEGLGKRYRIGLPQKQGQTRLQSIQNLVVSPFNYLRTTLRQPHEEEIVWALKNVSFEVQQGEVLGVIGRNGAGKSTLLKILSRITEPTTGRAEVYGRVASLLEVGTGFHNELTGRENIYLNGAILGMKKREVDGKFDEILEFAGVEKFIDTPVKRYSTGMRLRLAFAVAAHLEPEILIIDEVLAVGDAEFQKKCIGKMSSVAGEGRTVLFVSHNMGAVERLCTRGMLLENGEIAQNGPVQQVIADYLQSGLRQLGEQVWTDPATAPGDDVVRLRAVRACNAQGQVASQFKVTEPFCVEVEFWVLEPDYKLVVGLHFYDGLGTLIFAAGDFQDSTWHHRPHPVGIHRTGCHIPGNFLNEGTITVLATVATPLDTQHARERDAITLRIIDDMEPGGARGNHTKEWPGGAVRPLMEWSSDFEPLDSPQYRRVNPGPKQMPGENRGSRQRARSEAGKRDRS